MELQIGDRLTDETGEWEVISRPYASAGGKIASAHVRRVGRPDVTDLRTWAVRAAPHEALEFPTVLRPREERHLALEIFLSQTAEYFKGESGE